MHALDLRGLQDPSVTQWSMWGGRAPLVFGALKALASDHGEVKSMRVEDAHQRCGLSAAMLDHLMTEAATRGYTRLSLETGSMEAFAPARRLYERAGFERGPPFAGYRNDPLSCC